MKKFLLLLLVALLLLVSCKKDSAALTFDAAKDVLDNDPFFASFTRADEDFIATNFGSPAPPKSGTVYFSDAGEIGIFSLDSADEAHKMRETIKDYLDTERAATVSLSELYPASELSARLDRFDNALVVEEGDFVYYILLDADARSEAARRLDRKRA